MKRLFKSFFVCVIILSLSLIAVACNTPQPPEEEATIKAEEAKKEEKKPAAKKPAKKPVEKKEEGAE